MSAQFLSVQVYSSTRAFGYFVHVQFRPYACKPRVRSGGGGAGVLSSCLRLIFRFMIRQENTMAA